MDYPFRVTIWNKSLTRLGWIGDPIALTVTPRHMAQGTASFTIRNGHPRIPYCVAPDARFTIDYHGQQIFSGPLDGWQLNGGDLDGTMTINIRDDKRLWWNVLGWPNPTQLINAQNTGGVKEDKATGAAETVAKGFATRNLIDRLTLPIPTTVAATHGYGSTITVAMRMTPLADNLMDVVEQAGVGLTAYQNGSSGLVMDAYLPNVYPHTLTERSGVLIPGTATWTAHTATRTVVTGPGVGTSREWLLRSNTALETLTGDIWEVLTDASSSDVTTEREAAGDAALTAAGPKSGFSLALSETGSFKYGENLTVGDQVTIDLGSGNTITDVIRECNLTWTRDNGLEVVPTIGERTDDGTTKTAQILAALARAVRKLKTT